MTSTLLTLHDPEMARRYYAEGLWRRDTLYSLLCEHAERRPGAFAVRDATRRLTWRELRAMADAVAGDLHIAGLKRGERVAVWLPNRVEAVAILLACSRQGYVCNPSLHQNYRVGDIVELLTRIRAAALFAIPGYGADARTADVFAASQALPSLRRVYTLGDGPSAAALFPTKSGAAAASRCRPGQDRLSCLYLGHHRHAQGRHAFRQHLARERQGDGRRLGSRRAFGAAEPEPDEPPHRRRRGRADAGGRAGTRRRTRRPPVSMRSTGSSRRALPM